MAIPPDAATVLVPDNAAPVELLLSASVTLFVALVTSVPWASSIRTLTAGVIGEPVATLDGCTENWSWVAAPAEITMALLGGVPEMSSRFGTLNPMV